MRLCACCACVFYRLLVKNTGSLKVTESTCATDARAQFLGSAYWRHRLEAGDAEGAGGGLWMPVCGCRCNFYWFPKASFKDRKGREL